MPLYSSLNILCSPTINMTSTVMYGMIEFNLKDFKFYSENNPYMMYCNKKSYCTLCKKIFKGKPGAQSHSSKIHHTTLDDKKSKQPGNTEQKVISDTNQNSEIVFTEIKTDEDNLSVMSDMKIIDDKINLNFKINQLESQGLHTQANEIREKHDLHKVMSPEKPVDNTTQNMLQMMWMSESDIFRKNQMFELITMKFAGMSDGDVMMGLVNLPSPKSQKPESSDLMKLFLVPLLQKMNQNPVDNLIKYQSLLPKKMPLDFEEFQSRIKKFKSSQNIVPKSLDKKQSKDISVKLVDPKKQPTPSKDTFAKHTGKLSFKRVCPKSSISSKNTKTFFFKSPNDLKSNKTNS
jgi:hypothetical protein